MPMQIDNLKAQKIIKVVLDGFPTPEATKAALQNYFDIIKGIAPTTYSLLIDCTNLGVFTQDSIPVLQRLYQLYMDTGFKNIVFIKSKGAIQNSQLTRVGRMVDGFKGVFVDTMDEALSICVK